MSTQSCGSSMSVLTSSRESVGISVDEFVPYAMNCDQMLRIVGLAAVVIVIHKEQIT